MSVLNLVLAVILGLIFAYVAVQNSALVMVQLGSYTLQSIPLYLVAFASFVVGVLISGLFSLAGWTSSALTIAGKESQLTKTQKILADLKNRVNKLELENAQLKGETRRVTETIKEMPVGTSVPYHPHVSFWDRLRYRLAI